jgi:hypothetical protein
MLWSFANSYASWLTWDQHPYWLTLVLFATPMIHEVHFF